MNQHALDERRKAFFNERAEKWMDMWYHDPAARSRNRFEREFKRLFSPVSLRKNDVILDVGCGSGVLVPYILRRLGPKGRLYEVDYADKMMEVNRRLHTDPRIMFYVADVNALPLPKESCNGIFCFSCFPHFQDKPRAMCGMAAVLKTGGWLLLAHFDSPEALNQHHASSHLAVKHDRMPDEAAMRTLFTGAGLTIIRHVNEDGFYAVLAKRLT